jgi:peroxiredoxin
MLATKLANIFGVFAPKPDLPTAEKFYPLAPDFDLPDIDGKSIKLTQLLKNYKTLLITCLPGIWAPWSRTLLNELEQNQAQFEAKNCLPIVLVSQTPSELLKYKYKPAISILFDTYGGVIQRFASQIREELHFAPLARPLLFVVNQDQQITISKAGSVSQDYKLIPQLLRKL